MKILTFVLLLALSLTGCSLSKQSRQQRAYEKYVRKSSVARAKQRSKLRSDKPPMPMSPMPIEPIESTETGPQAAPSDG